MTWFDWTLIGLWVVGIVIRTSLVGKPRKPMKPGEAAFADVLAVGLIAGLLITRGVIG